LTPNLISLNKSKYNYQDDPVLVVDLPKPERFMNVDYSLGELLDINDKIEYEGKIYRYKPGFSSIYTDRWMQLTESGVIRIYKDQL
jgi:hypothetical protein